MLEAVDKVAEEHERNVRLVLLLLAGMRALETGPRPAAVAESFMLKLLSLSGFHPSLTACAVCGATDRSCSRPAWAARSVPVDAELGAGPRLRGGAGVPGAARARGPRRGRVDAAARDSHPARRRAALLFGFAEYHLERRMKSLPMLVRTAP